MRQEVFVTVGVAKAWLDVHHPAHGVRRIDNTPATQRIFTAACAREGVWIFFEGSGGYDRLLRDTFGVANVRLGRVSPRHTHDFARATGVIDKTEVVNARMLSELGACLSPAQTEPLAAPLRSCQAQATRRPQLVELRKEEATLLRQTPDAEARADIAASSPCSIAASPRLKRRMPPFVAADPEPAGIGRRLQTISGVGPVVATTLIADLSELGRLHRRPRRSRQLARVSGSALAAAPSAADDPRSRRCSTSPHHASRRCHLFKLSTAGWKPLANPVKAAITATARRLLGVLQPNARLGTDKRV